MHLKTILGEISSLFQAQVKINLVGFKNETQRFKQRSKEMKYSNNTI